MTFCFDLPNGTSTSAQSYAESVTVPLFANVATQVSFGSGQITISYVPNTGTQEALVTVPSEED